MDFVTFKDLNLSSEELRDIIEFIAKKRNVELLSAIKEKSRNLTPKKPLKNLKCKIIKNLTPKKPLKNLKCKISENLTLKKSLKNIKSKKSKILTLKKSLVNLKRESNQFLASKNKKIEKYLEWNGKCEWKVQLSAEINFISLKPGSDETRVMYTRSDNEEFRSGSDTEEVIKLLFRSFLQKYQENIQNKMRGSDFEFDGVNLLYYNFNKINLNRGGSYIEPAKWIKDKKSIINPKNNDHKCFQYVVTLALNYDKIDRNPQRISKIRPFIDQYNWKDIDFPATSKDWKKFEQNNELIALNILYVPHNTKKIHIAYKSRHNLTQEKQVILLLITDGKKWHCLVLKDLSGLLRGVTSNHHGDFYCLNCFHSYSTKNKLEAHKKICENHDYCYVEMPTKDNNIIKYNQGEKSIKLPFVIYADLECLLEKMSTCINNPNESSTTEINKHTTSGYSIFTSCSFDESKNKINYYRGDDCMKKFCKDLREHAMKIINYEKKRMVPLTIKEEVCYHKQKICYICKKEFHNNDKKQQKVKDHCHYTGKYRGAAHNICNLRYKVPKEIPLVFHNDSIYDYHFIIKELVKEFDGNFDCLGENTEKYITFSIPLKKKIENKDIEINYKIKFIDNLSEEIHNNKCFDCKSNLDYIRITKNEKLLLKCFNCNIYYKKKLNKELIKKFKNTYSFCDNDLNKFILLLRKGVYPYEYMDSWERFNETSLPNKEDFYSNLNMEDIDDIDYRHGNNVFKGFKLENFRDYHDLYVQSDILLLADMFENFRGMCIKEYELDPAHFLSLPGLAWQACLKKTNIELELSTNYDMLLMVEERMRGGICHSIHRYAKANNKYVKNYNKDEELSYIQYLDANNLYGWAMSKKLPVNGFKWIDNNEINGEFIKNYNENNNKGYILEVDVRYLERLHELHSDLPFLLNE